MSTDIFASYYRRIKTYTKLPSLGQYYDDSIIDISSGGEVGVKPMNVDDELLLKNQDALFNGEAITTVLLNCVDGLKQPHKLFTNDVDALLTAIRIATYGDPTEFTSVCAKCGHQNTYAIELSKKLESTTSLDSTYTVTTESGLTMYVKPFTHKHKIELLQVIFEQEKITSTISSNDGDISAAIQESIRKLISTNTMLISQSIYRIVDSNNDIDLVIDDSNVEDLRKLLFNIELKDAETIEQKVKDLNNIGMDKHVTVACDDCEHEWTTEMETNPVNFSLGS